MDYKSLTNNNLIRIVMASNMDMASKLEKELANRLDILQSKVDKNKKIINECMKDFNY